MKTGYFWFFFLIYVAFQTMYPKAIPGSEIEESQFHKYLMELDHEKAASINGAKEYAIKALRNENWEIRSSAAEFLGFIQDIGVFEPLVAALEDTDDFVVNSAVYSISQIGIKNLNLLLDTLDNDSWKIRRGITKALVRTKNPDIVPYLIKIMMRKYEHPAVRGAAIIGLGDIGDKRAVEFLKKLYESEKNNYLKYLEKSALRKLNIQVQMLPNTLPEKVVIFVVDEFDGPDPHGESVAELANEYSLGRCEMVKIPDSKIAYMTKYIEENNIIAVINLSWGTSKDDLFLRSLIQDLYYGGALIIAAAGNDNSSDPYYPASYEGVYAVAAVGFTGKKEIYSNYGTYIDISASGGMVKTKYVNEIRDGKWNRGEQTIIRGGTSFAAPKVTGRAAYLLYRRPDLCPKEVIELIKRTAKPVDKRYDLGAGKITFFKLLYHAGSANITIKHIVSFTLRNPFTILPVFLLLIFIFVVLIVIAYISIYIMVNIINSMINSYVNFIINRRIAKIQDAREKGTIETVIKFLEDKYVLVRMNAAFTLGDIKDPIAVDPLIKAFTDKEWGVRANIAEALGKIKSKTANNALKIALNDEVIQVRRNSIWALAQIGDNEAIDILINALGSHYSDVKNDVVGILSLIGDEFATEILTNALQIHKNPEVRSILAFILSRIGNEKAIDSLIYALKSDTHQKVRLNTVKALAQLNGIRVITALEDVLGDINSDVSRTARIAIDIIKQRENESSNEN